MREGKFFSRVCQSVSGGGGSHVRGHIGPPSPGHLGICSNLLGLPPKGLLLLDVLGLHRLKNGTQTNLKKGTDKKIS